MITLKSDNLDLNIAYPLIAERLKQVKGVKAVRGANDLAQVLSGSQTGSDSYVYLIFDGISETGIKSGSNQETRFNQFIGVSYGVMVGCQTYSGDGMPKHIGELLGAILVSLSGFAPISRDSRTKNILTATNAGKPVHSYGHSVYPLKFNLDVLITGQR